MGRLVIVSNRVPAPRERAVAAGGLAVAMRDALAGREALWFGWSGRTVPGEQPRMSQVTQHGRLSTAMLDLNETLFDGFYRGFSNGVLWPLLHWRLGLTDFSRDAMAAYHAANDAFATALIGLLRPDDVVWVQDYHLIPLGAALRRLGATGRIGFFLHVPFPPPAVFNAVPGADALLKSFLAYDLIGLQTEEDAVHLRQALPDDAAGRVGAFPIGIDPDGFALAAARAVAGPDVRRLRDSLAGRSLILGVDRLDYTKGLPQRFRAFAQLLRRFPEHRSKVTLLQIAPVSRGDVAQYRSLRRELDELAGRINGEHAEFDWMPLRYLTRAMPRNTLAGAHRVARVGLVTPLRDGMNLVAKEYVAAQDPDDPGALVLSRFAGAAGELQGALLVNPYDPDEIAEAMHTALALPRAERQARWRGMRDAVWQNTAATWARDFLASLEDALARAA